MIPTYNEEATVGKIIGRVLKDFDCDILIVDDNSTDNTKDEIKRHVDTDRVFMLERPSKLGLGTAYITGFKWGIQRNYELFFEMDADLSHDPKTIPAFVEKIQEGCDIVVGSRYLNNTISVVGWDFKRLLLSRFGNLYASTLLNLRQFSDLTSGYRCYTRKAVEAIEIDKVKSNGYAFQIEMVHRGFKKGLKIAEIPIIFYERENGGSKMSGKIVREAILLPFRLKIERFLNK